MIWMRKNWSNLKNTFWLCSLCWYFEYMFLCKMKATFLPQGRKCFLEIHIRHLQYISNRAFWYVFIKLGQLVIYTHSVGHRCLHGISRYHITCHLACRQREKLRHKNIIHSWICTFIKNGRLSFCGIELQHTAVALCVCNCMHIRLEYRKCTGLSTKKKYITCKKTYIKCKKTY